MRKITKSTRSKCTVHHQKLQHVNNHKTKSFGNKPVTLFKNVKSVKKCFQHHSFKHGMTNAIKRSR